jgi:hypothetical protein
MRAFPTPLLAALLVAALAPATAAPAATTLGAKAAPADAGVTGDVRCLLTMVALSNLNKDHPQAAQFGIPFFIGRIKARAPGLDLAAAVKAQAPTMGGPQLQAELLRCGPLVSAAGQSFQAAINSLRPAGAPAGAPVPAAPPAIPQAAPK